MHADGISFLSAEWLNARVVNVLDKLEKLLGEGAIDGGLLSSGYFPLETPVQPTDFRRMTPEQLSAYVGGLSSIEDKQEAMAKIGRVHPGLLPTKQDLRDSAF